MVINGIKSFPGDSAVSSRSIAEQRASDSVPSKDAIKEGTQTKSTPPPRRSQTLGNTINESLNQAGLDTATANALESVDAKQSVQTKNDPETSRNEKVGQALQAFMHTLVQSLNSSGSETGGAPTSVTAPAARDSNPAATRAADAYGGLLSRLESLVWELEGGGPPNPGDTPTTQLNAALRDLVAETASGGSSRTSAAPDLRAVLTHVIRNLQSTGDPTLASTGNVINTSA